MPYVIPNPIVDTFVDGYGDAHVAVDIDRAAVALTDAHMRQLDIHEARDALAFVGRQDFGTVVDADALLRSPQRPALLPVIAGTFYDTAIALAWLIIYVAAQHQLAERYVIETGL